MTVNVEIISNQLADPLISKREMARELRLRRDPHSIIHEGEWYRRVVWLLLNALVEVNARLH